MAAALIICTMETCRHSVRLSNKHISCSNITEVREGSRVLLFLSDAGTLWPQLTCGFGKLWQEWVSGRLLSCQEVLTFPKETQPRFIKPCHRAKRIKYFLRLQLILKLKCGPKDPTYERPVKFLKEMCKMSCLSILKWGKIEIPLPLPHIHDF